MKEIHKTPWSIRHRIRKRQRTARHTARKLHRAKQWPALLKRLTQALYEAERDPTAFQNACGEPSPAHLLRVLRFEIALWIRLRETLEQTQKQETTETDWKQLRPTILALTRALREVLAIERDILRSPLIQAHLRQLQAAQQRLRRRT